MAVRPIDGMRLVGIMRRERPTVAGCSEEQTCVEAVGLGN